MVAMQRRHSTVIFGHCDTVRKDMRVAQVTLDWIESMKFKFASAFHQPPSSPKVPKGGKIARAIG
jgi:hypothetical protein